jgi:hypothetical protein
LLTAFAGGNSADQPDAKNGFNAVGRNGSKMLDPTRFA